MTTIFGGVKIPEITYPVLTAISTEYISVDFLEDYVDILGLDSTFPAAGTNDTEKQSAVYRSQVYLESLVFQGDKYDLSQILQWPRSNVYDRNGNMVTSDQVPYDIFNAVAEGAFLEYNTIGCLQPTVVPTSLAPITSEEVRAGSVASITSYDTSKLAPSLRNKVGADYYSRLQHYLGQWLAGRSASVIRLVRS